MKLIEVRMIAIIGPTASGKSELAIRLADKHDGEIICADSRTIYRGMDIGTAKPTPADQARVPHHLIDIVDPGQSLSAGEFKRLAIAAAVDIRTRGKVPFLVGGSGLYIDAMLFDYKFPLAAEGRERERLDSMDDNSLRELLQLNDPRAYSTVDVANRRRVIRAIETAGQDRSRSEVVVPDALVLGLRLHNDVIQERIMLRVHKMLDKGFIAEVRNIGETFGWDSDALNIVGYRSIADVLKHGKSIEDATEEIVRGHVALYKKQVTWFKRNHWVQWLDSDEASTRMVAAKMVGEFINR